jgi:kynureninase
LQEEDLNAITASGPPLAVVLRSLETLRDLRTAVKRQDLATRHDDLMALKRSLRG